MYLFSNYYLVLRLYIFKFYKLIFYLYFKSSFNNDKNLLTEAVIEIEIHANVDSLKKDQSIRDKINLKVLQDKFNSNLNDQEKFYECLEKFFNNLSSKIPTPDEKRLWKRIVKTNPRLS